MAQLSTIITWLVAVCEACNSNWVITVGQARLVEVGYHNWAVCVLVDRTAAAIARIIAHKVAMAISCATNSKEPKCVK
jgi:hypothetical protein